MSQNYFQSHLRFLCLVLFLLYFGINDAVAQREPVQLTFNEDGKLLGGYPDRFNLPLNAEMAPKRSKGKNSKATDNENNNNCPPGVHRKDCPDDYVLSVRVLLPAGFYMEELEKMNERALLAYKALNDPTSTLYNILNCCDGAESDLVKIKKVISDSSITKWASVNTNYIPGELFGYSAFLNGFARRDCRLLNSLREFAPFRLYIKGVELDTACMRFVKVDNATDVCDCIKDNGQYMALEFNIPQNLMLRNLSPDSFLLVRKYQMKEKAVKWYNDMLKSHKEEMPGLKLLEKRIRDKSEALTTLLNEIDSLKALEVYCNDTVKQKELRLGINERICNYKGIIDKEFGEYTCNNTCRNALLCSKIFRTWIAKLIWLNGDQVRFNPFDFTLSKYLVGVQSKEKKEAAAARIIQKEAGIRLKFWETAISHLEDSIMRRDVNIDTAKNRLKLLLAARMEALTMYNKPVPEVSGDALVDNVKLMKEFLTTSQVNYKGWVVPYKTGEKNPAYNPDKIWLRNYYVDQMPNPLRQQLHYTYPENENVTLLLHNLSSNVGSSRNESIVPYADSAAFTIIAGEFISQATSLYASLSPVAPLVKTLLKNAGVNKPENNEIPESASAILTGFSLKSITNFTDNDIRATINSNNEKFNPYGFLISDINNKKILVASYKRNITADSVEKYVNLSSINNLEALQKSNKAVKSILVDLNSPNFGSIKKFISQNEYTLVEFVYKGAGYKSESFVAKMDSSSIDRLFNLFKANIYKTNSKPDCPDSITVCYQNYLQSVYELIKSPKFIDDNLKGMSDTVPIYRTDKWPLSDKEAPYTNKYGLRTVVRDDDKQVPQYLIDSSYINVGKFRYLQSAAGIAVTPNAGFITSVDTSNGGFVISRDEDKVRMIAGLRWYPCGLYNQKNPVSLFREKRWLHRLSFIVATGIPKPLQNIYLGGGFDIVPGLNFSGGIHLQQQNKFNIVNNQVKDKTVGYKGNGFYAITIDPALFINAVKSLF